jgi:EmrB/QacA subfamily drug resistance transporter
VSEDVLRYRSTRGRWVVAATVLGSGMASLDMTVVNIALPRIGKDFHTGVAALQWVVTAYTLTLAAFLLLGGTLGDRYGRRRVFAIGVGWFALASALCGLAPDQGVLIGARILQGVGGALLTPGSLALLQASFVAEDRSRVIGVWAGLGGLTTAAGPLVGGYLLTVSSWRWVFLINLPLAVAVLSVTRRQVPESADPDAAGGRLDVAGAALGVLSLGVLSLGALTYGLIEGPGAGWGSPLIVTALVLAAAAAAGFALVESRAAHPMLPGSIFVDRQFSATNAVTFLVYAALSGALFLLPVSLQQVSGYSPLAAGSALLPVTAIMLVFSARSGRLAARIGPRLQMSVGPLLAGGGLALLVRSTSDHSYAGGLLPGVLLLACGLAVTVAPLTATAMSSAPTAHSGVASAVNNDVARAGGLLAVATLPTVAGITGAAYLHPAVFAHGFRTAMDVCGALAGAGGLLALATIRNPRRTPAGPAAEGHLLRDHPCLNIAGPPTTAPPRHAAFEPAGRGHTLPP